MATDGNGSNQNRGDKRIWSPARDSDGRGDIPKVRVIDRLLAQDANQEAKVDFMFGQLKNLDEFAREVTGWMRRTEDGYRADTKKFAGDIQNIEDRLVAVEALPKPPGLSDMPEEIAEKLAYVAGLEAKIEAAVADTQKVMAVTDLLNGNLTELAGRLDEYTRQLESQTVNTNDQIGDCIKVLGKLEVETREEVVKLEKTYSEFKQGYKETVEGILGDIRRLQASQSRRGESAPGAPGAAGPSAPAPAPSAPGGGRDGDGPKRFHVHIGSDNGDDCHCEHVEQLIESVETLRAEIVAIKDDINGNHRRVSSATNAVEDLRQRLEAGLQMSERVRALITKLEESGGDPWAWGSKDVGGRTESRRDASEVPKRDSSGAPFQWSGSATPWGSTAACGPSRERDQGQGAGSAWNGGSCSGARFGMAPAFTREASRGTGLSHGAGPSPSPLGERGLDEKIAALTDYQYNGSNGGDKWRIKTRNYIIGKSPAMLPVLKWVEQLGETPCDVASTRSAIAEYGMMVEVDIEKISANIWSFLSTCLSGAAMTIFESVDVLNGLDAWRQLHNHIQKGSATRRLTLREPAIHPRAARNEEEVNMAITKWEIDYKKYLDAGGSELNDEDLRMTLLQLLPQQLREGLIWRATESRCYAEFREHVRIKSEQILMLRSKLPVYAAVEQTEFGKLLAEEFPDSKPDDILALVNRLRSQARPGAPGAARPAREPRCANCGGTHLAKDCKTPWIEDPKLRVCFICGKPGCRANRCPQRDQKAGGRAAPRSAKSLEEVNLETLSLEIACMDDGFAPVARKHAARAVPMARGATLGDFMKNRYELDNEDNMNDPNTKFAVELNEPNFSVNSSITSSTKSTTTRRNAGSCDSDRKHYNRVYEAAMQVDRKKALEVAEMAMKAMNPESRAATTRDRAKLMSLVGEQSRILATECEANDLEILCGNCDVSAEECCPLEIVDMAQEVNVADTGDDGEDRYIEIAADSACGKHVMHPDDARDHKVEPSPGSLASQHFMAASGHVIENEGQANLKLSTEEDRTLSSCFQMAKVSRPLYSVPQMTDEGCTVVFSKGVGKVLKGKVRIQAERDVATFKRKGGLYVARMRVNKPGDAATADFRRQGAKR